MLSLKTKGKKGKKLYNFQVCLEKDIFLKIKGYGKTWDNEAGDTGLCATCHVFHGPTKTHARVGGDQEEGGRWELVIVALCH